MNGAHYIGQKALSLTEYEKRPPISKIILWVDDENYYEAGDETGLVIEQDCPYASQAMANNLLASMQGYQYQPIHADGAKVSPDAELGDGITVNGVYTQLAYQNIRFSTGEVMDVAAPGSEETLHEYKTQGETTRQFEHQIAQTRSLIAKTAEAITLRVDGLEDDYTELSVTLDGVTIKDSSGQTLIKGSSIDTTTIKANSITSDKLVLTGSISFSDLDDGVQMDIDSAYSMANSAYNLAQANQLPDYIQSTYIDSTDIMSPNIYSNSLSIMPTESGTGTFSLYGRYNNQQYNMFQIQYFSGAGAYVNFGSPASAFANWNFGNTYYSGRVQFTGTVDLEHADVTGLYLRYS